MWNAYRKFPKPHNINVCDSSAVVSILRTNPLCPTVPALYAVRSDSSPVGATENKMLLNSFVHMSSSAESCHRRKKET